MTVDERALFGQFINHWRERTPNAVAAVFGDVRWTYGELDERVVECARALIAWGIRRGDRVAMLTSPRPEFAVLFLACARIGAVWVGLNPVQTLDEYRHIVGDARPSLLFGFGMLRGRDNRETLQALAAEFSFIRKLVVLDEAGGESADVRSFLELGGTVAPTEVESRTAGVEAGDGALIVYTSGSTGKPKGAVLTQRNIAHCARMYCRLWDIEHLSVICNLPVTHVACCVETVAYSLASGGVVVFQEQFEAAAYLQAIEAEKVSWTPLVPTMFQRIRAIPDWKRFDTGSLRVILFGGAAMPADMIEELRGLAPHVVGCWGMTETTSGVTFTDDDDSLDVLRISVGRPAPTIEMGIMGDGGRLLGPEEVGEVVVRGPCVFQGYFGQPEATRDTIDADGWLHSGDLGRMDAQGRYSIVGRIKEMFKSGGYNVYPREVETVIEAHEAASMAVVVPVPDPVYQEVGFAYVLRERGLALTAQQVLDHCRRKLANYKIPKRVFVRDSLPMLANGKIDRAALRLEAVEAARA